MPFLSDTEKNYERNILNNKIAPFLRQNIVKKKCDGKHLLDTYRGKGKCKSLNIITNRMIIFQ